jgi:hypothetical protein
VADQWLKRLLCDHSEAVGVGSKPGACDCKVSLVPGKRLALEFGICGAIHIDLLLAGFKLPCMLWRFIELGTHAARCRPMISPSAGFKTLSPWKAIFFAATLFLRKLNQCVNSPGWSLLAFQVLYKESKNYVE